MVAQGYLVTLASNDHPITLEQLLAIIAVLTAVIGFFGWVLPFIRKLVHVIDDMVGEEPRPGVPERPGMLVRMQRVETASAEALTIARTNALAHKEIRESLKELKHNNGSSLRDSVERIEVKLDMLADKDDSNHA